MLITTVNRRRANCTRCLLSTFRQSALIIKSRSEQMSTGIDSAIVRKCMIHEARTLAVGLGMYFL